MLSPSDIEKIVDDVFILFAPLSVTGTLSKEEVSGYNFLSGETIGASTTVVVTLIPLEKNYEGGVSTYKFVAKSKDIPEYTYSSITISGDTYRIEKSTKYEGLTTLDLKRED